MKHKISHVVMLALVMLVGSAGMLNGQFYNGHQMTFGKNRVQYNNFYWQYYRFERFDTYFTQDGNELALYTEQAATPELNRIEGIFDYVLEKRIIFIIYNKLTDFRQGNIGLITGSDEYNIGGVTRVVDNKVFLYFDGDHEAFDRQIKASIAEVVLNEMLYGAALRTNMTRSATINMPEWYNAGLISYISEPWSVEMDDRIKNGLANGSYRKFTRLTGEDAKWAGHSFWRFIEKEYGLAVLSNIVYITRLNKNIKTGFMSVLGDNLKGLTKAWQTYYTNLYANEDGNPPPDNPKLVKRPRKYRVYEKMKISPDGKTLAYVTNDMGRYRIWLQNLETGKKKCIYRREHKLEQIQDYSYPVLAWHPSGELLMFIYEAEGGLKMSFYNVAQKHIDTRNLLYFEKIQAANFSPDGSQLVMSAYRYGRSDIVVHTLASGTNENITDDFADDFDPAFIQNGTKIVFASRRTDDTLRRDGATIHRLSPGRNLFVYDYAGRASQLTPLAGEPYARSSQPVEIDNNRYAYLSDLNGVTNRYVMRFDSVISFIDTAVHYRYESQARPLTNFSRSILDHDVSASSGKATSIFRSKFRYNMYDRIFTGDTLAPLAPTTFRRETIRKQRELDSLDNVARNAIPAILLDDGDILTPDGDTIHFDMNKVDIYRYVFEVEKLNFYQHDGQLTDFKVVDDSIQKERHKIRIYEPVFYPNYLVSQVDFSFLETSYQAYTGGAVYYNPGFNLLFKLGASDLFEDYKVVGGVRFGIDFTSNEYLLSVENVKHRLDKQLVFHRQAFENYAVDQNYNYYPLKTHSHELFYIMRYPFTQTFAVKGTISFRDDRTVFQTDANNPISLTMPNERRDWAGLKLEFIFDNIRKIGVNIPSGFRWKLFGESYWQVNDFSDLYVLGADFRYYQVIHRNLIWAARFAGSSSFGRSRLLYYLGSLDNWITWFSNRTVFDNTVRVDNRENYAYQTLATNMRGFVQNIRNGNNFALINNEIRWPFIQYFANYPLSNFWSSLQAVAFCDIGTAWSGVSPFRKTSAYDHEYIYNNDNPDNATVAITLDTGRKPIVYGYGFGLRMQLLGYFLRFDYAWGVENNVRQPGIFYFSMNLDF